MFFILAIVVAYFVIVGVYSYVYALVSKKTSKSGGYGFGFFVGYFGINVAMIIFEIVLLVNPVLGFACVHWGWILAVGILMCIASIVIGIYFIYQNVENYEDTLVQGIVYILLGILVLTFSIFGVTAVRQAPTVTISNAFEMRCLANMPQNKNGLYKVELDKDIDFDGKKPSKYGTSNSNFAINGNGHSIKNINFELELEEENSYLFKFGDLSKLENVKIENWNVTLIPNYYDDVSHEGKLTNYYLFGENDIKMNGLAFENVVITVKPGKDNLTSITPSTIGEIKTYGREDITIVREDIIE